MKNEEIKRQNLNRVLEASAKLFFEKGIEATTMNEIAAASGVSKVSIYKHFESKCDIASRLFHDLVEAVSEDYRANIFTEGYGRLSGAEQLRAILDSYAHATKDDPTFYALFVDYNIYLLRHEPLGGKVERLYESIDSIIRPRFLAAYEKGRADGTVTVDRSAEEMYELISGALRGTYLSYFLRTIPFVNAEKLDHLQKMLTLATRAVYRLLTE